MQVPDLMTDVVISVKPGADVWSGEEWLKSCGVGAHSMVWGKLDDGAEKCIGPEHEVKRATLGRMAELIAARAAREFPHDDEVRTDGSLYEKAFYALLYRGRISAFEVAKEVSEERDNERADRAEMERLEMEVER